jgi:hypothetical protein
VLDIGIMEGRFSVLAARAGGRVTSYDRLDLSQRINLVQEAYGVALDYRPGEPFHKFVTKYHAEGGLGFQAIIFSGVLYHTIDPLIFLYYVQSLLRPGGYMVLQTSVVVDDKCFLQFNDRGRFKGVTKFYQVSSGWLDYILRFFGFSILDCAHIVGAASRVDGHFIPQLALICRKNDARNLDPEDTWGRDNSMPRELAEYLPLRPMEPTDITSSIRARTSRPPFPLQGRASINLTETIRNSETVNFDPEKIAMTLEDRLYATDV